MHRNGILIALFTLLTASACAKKTEAEIIAEFKQIETQSCITSWKASNTNGAPESMIVSVCGCAIEKLVDTYPVEKLNTMVREDDPAMESMMMPIVMQCAQKEVDKKK